MKKNIGVVGCGIVGLLVSYKFSQLGHKVTIFEKGNGLNLSNCSVTAAGMISPYCELIHSDKKIFELGETSLLKWKKIIKELNSRIFFKSKGSLVVTQIAEKSDLELICERVNSHTKSKLKILTNKQIQKLEPDIDLGLKKGISILFPNFFIQNFLYFFESVETIILFINFDFKAVFIE